MRKTSISLKDFIVIFVSLLALLISFFAIREARLSNILNIEPVISAYYKKGDKEGGLEFIIKNEGNIDVKNINITWATAFIKSERKEPGIHMSSTDYLSNFLEVNKTTSCLIYISSAIDLINKMPEEDIQFFIEKHIYDTPDGSIVKDKGRGGLFLILNVEYRRISDSKLFKKTSYFSIIPLSLKIDVADIEKLPTSDYRIYKRMLENVFFHPDSSYEK